MFNDARIAYNILKQQGVPLSTQEIVKVAMQGQWHGEQMSLDDMLYTSLLVDINLYKETSMFIQVGPRLFDVNPDYNPSKNERHEINKFLDMIMVDIEKQTAILEHSICDIINFYGMDQLKCWKESEYEGGLALIIEDVAQDFSSSHLSVQVHAGIGSQPTWYGIYVPNTTLDFDADFQLFCYFDTNVASLWHLIWFIPTNDFVKYAPIVMNGEGKLCRSFHGGVRSAQAVVWEEYMITKRRLTDVIRARMKAVHV